MTDLSQDITALTKAIKDMQVSELGDVSDELCALLKTISEFPSPLWVYVTKGSHKPRKLKRVPMSAFRSPVFKEPDAAFDQWVKLGALWCAANRFPNNPFKQRARLLVGDFYRQGMSVSDVAKRYNGANAIAMHKEDPYQRGKATNIMGR